MDGVREAVYAGKPPESYEVHKLNVIARDLTAELDLPFLDLQATFADRLSRATLAASSSPSTGTGTCSATSWRARRSRRSC